MKDFLFARVIAVSDRRQVRFVLMLILLALFVLGAGAPETAGGPGG